MGAVDDYYAALERLKKNKPVNVPKGTAINKDTVAMEAGKKRGSIRKRPGFEQLIDDIEKASEAIAKRTPKEIAGKQVAKKDAEIGALRRENEILKTRYMSLLYQNYEMANLIQKHNIQVPKFGSARSISILEEKMQ
ncbi:hypothetical protein DET50_107141 [Marinobacter pelagius]|uniref:Uncharacterized protein n=1 Tax=Marinobacter pelagius TaxID=379482 RepID=A0A366GSS4_9GAMM|nr:hypothetical protein [Marinobacter pelagius]RBP30726.1 hypothetical protein DET50_107141 [Marinobacter pelagius]